MNQLIWHDSINFRFLLSTGNAEKYKKTNEGMILDLNRAKLSFEDYFRFYRMWKIHCIVDKNLSKSNTDNLCGKIVSF